jgi:serine/threonine protein kinase
LIYIYSNGCVADHEGRLYIQNYELIAILGRGGFGDVILARKRSTGGRSSSRELVALKAVRHPHISKVEKEVLL